MGAAGRLYGSSLLKSLVARLHLLSGDLSVAPRGWCAFVSCCWELGGGSGGKGERGRTHAPPLILTWVLLRSHRCVSEYQPGPLAH